MPQKLVRAHMAMDRRKLNKFPFRCGNRTVLCWLALCAGLFGLVAATAAAERQPLSGKGGDHFGDCVRIHSLPQAEIDAGGVAYDFSAITERRFPIPKIGDPGNLIDREEFTDDDWGKDKHAKAKFVRLPDSAGSRFRLSFRYRMRHRKGELGYAFVFYYSRDPKTGKLVERKDVKASYSYYDVWVLKNEWADWNRFSREFTAPAGPDTVKVVLRLDGDGDLLFEDPGLAAVAAEEVKPVAFRMMPHGLLDGTFRVSEGQCGMMAFRWTDNTSEKVDPKRCEFRFDLPKCVRMAGTTFADAKSIVRKPLKGGGERVTFRPDRRAFSAMRFAQTLLVTAAGKPGDSGEGVMRVFHDGVQVSGDERIRFEIVRRISAMRPKRYQNGVYVYQANATFEDAESDAAFAGMMADAGVGWVVADEVTPGMVSQWRKNGIAKVTPNARIANGYYMGDWQGRPKEDSFVATENAGDKTWDRYISRSTCPLAVIEERGYFVNHTVPKTLRPAARGADGLWANWEPFMFRGRGCRCAKCEAAYVRYHDETGRSRADFRSMLHGLLVRTVDRHVRRAVDGDSVGFIPGVSWREMASSWREKDPSPESRPIDYAAHMEWINPWGPYVYWDLRIPYIYQKRGPLAHFVAAKDVREQVDSDFPEASRRPKLMSFPQGIQCSGEWIAQPQWISMALDSFFFNRWECSVVYFFPEGYDARYWRAFAEATTRAARFEPFVLDGVRMDGMTELDVAREYAVPSRYVSTYLPNARNMPLLQQATYGNGDSRIVAAFNFWERGEAFFTLRAKGLAAGKYEVVDEDGVTYPASASERCWTADALESGAFLAVGAARTKVFGIYPAGRAPAASRAIPQDALRRRHAEMREALASAAAEDATREAANDVERTDSAGEL